MHKNSHHWVMGELPSRPSGSHPPARLSHGRHRPRLSRSALQHTLARYQAPSIRNPEGAALSAPLQLTALLMAGVLLVMITLQTPWPAFALPVILGVFFVCQKRTKLKHAAQSATLTPSEIQAFASGMLSQVLLLPENLAAKLQGVQDSLMRILNSPRQACLSFEDRHFLQQTAVRYLPDLCNYYQSLTTKSAAAALSFETQCALLKQRLEKIQGDLDARNSERLLQHEQFLRQKLPACDEIDAHTTNLPADDND